MRKMNIVFAVAFAIIGAGAFYGAVFCNTPWHIATTLVCLFLSTLFAADSGDSKTPGLSGK